MAGNYGSDEYGVSPYGGAYPPFGLESAVSLSSTSVRVRYTALFDSSYLPLTDPSNYSISPSITVTSVVIESAQSVILITSPQTDVVYTLVIDQARGYFGQSLDPDLDSVTFNGLPASPTFHAVATRATRVRAIFTEAMLQNAALTDPSEYTLSDLSGNLVVISDVEVEQVTDVRSVVLTLATDLEDEHHYRLTVSTSILTFDGDSISPDTSVFQWVSNALRTQVSLEDFSGEVQGGLYGVHGGLVFFSPALVNSAANSIIQVDSVEVCTKAYDEYHFPSPIDPPVLFTYGAGVVPTPTVTTLNSTAVTWAKFPRLVDATMTLSDLQEEEMPAAVDGPCDATLTETWDLDYVSLQNNTAWKTFDNAGEPPIYFKTADNLAPIPPGATVTINLQP